MHSSEAAGDNSVVVKLLKAEYNRRAQLRPLLWDNTIQLPLEHVYTRLKIVSRRKANIQVEDDEVNVFDISIALEKGEEALMLVEGNPGIGKSTFCLKLAYDWANGKVPTEFSFPKFEFVLLLKCRDIDGDIMETISEQLLPIDIDEKTREKLLDFIKDIHNQKRILIILDGLDDLPKRSQHHVDALLHRRILPFCYVLATSQQEQGIELQKKFIFDIHLEIKGFTETGAFEYIRKHCASIVPGHLLKGEKLIGEIKESTFLHALWQYPLHLVLLCVIYEDYEGELPTSCTELYQVIVQCLLRRFCAKRNLKAHEDNKALERQFEEDILALGELAWMCLLNDRHCFRETELKKLESRNKTLVAREIGLLYKEESLKRLEPQHEYYFLHKTFQEHLAASYVAQELRRNQFNLFEHLSFEDVVEKYRQVFLFVSGILGKEASILFTQIGEELKSSGDWDWHNCSKEVATFFAESFTESGNADLMAVTLCSFIPFPLVVNTDLISDGFVHVLKACKSFPDLQKPVKPLDVESSVLFTQLIVAPQYQAPPPKVAAAAAPGLGPSVAPQRPAPSPELAAATAPGPSADSIYSPMAMQHKMKKIATATMKFEAEHKECVRVLPYSNGDKVMVQFYVFSGESGIPEQLKLDAEECFGEMELKWSDLYNDAANILKVTTLEYPSGEPKRLNASQVDEISEVISKNLHVLEKHRNVTSVQASFKITESRQTENPCITIYVLGKGFIPIGESEFPHTLGPYPVDVVDGFWFRTNNPWFPNKAQEQSEVLRLGASIGVQGEKASGTLGAIVEDGGTFYALSCNHVMKHPTKSEIIHPGLNDHLNFLKYHLNEYRNRIEGIIERGFSEEGINFSVNSLKELNELSEKFEELKSIKGRHVNSERCNDRKLEYIMIHEDALKKRLNPPRVIGEYIPPGVFGNVKWTDDKEYFIDAAIAKLTPEEVNSLRESGTVETIEPNVSWGDNVECSPTTTTAIIDARELFKYGRTTGYTTTDCVINAWVDPPQFMKDSPKFRRYRGHPLPDMTMDTYLCHSCDTIQHTSCCESCQEMASPDFRWRKNCLCINRGKKDFIDSGDSGAVIFESKEESILGFGIIFAEHYGGYFRYAVASPLQVALKALSKTISEDSNLRLVSNFENIPTSPMKAISTVPLNQAAPPDAPEVAVPGPNGTPQNQTPSPE